MSDEPTNKLIGGIHQLLRFRKLNRNAQYCECGDQHHGTEECGLPVPDLGAVHEVCRCRKCSCIQCMPERHQSDFSVESNQERFERECDKLEPIAREAIRRNTHDPGRAVYDLFQRHVKEETLDDCEYMAQAITEQGTAKALGFASMTEWYEQWLWPKVFEPEIRKQAMTAKEIEVVREYFLRKLRERYAEDDPDHEVTS